MSQDSMIIKLMKRINDLESQIKRQATADRTFSRHAVEKIIAAGVVTVDHHNYIMLIPESGAVDDLVEIAGSYDGRRIILGLRYVGNTVTVKTGSGNILMDADVVLATQYDTLELVYNDIIDNWIRLS